MLSTVCSNYLLRQQTYILCVEYCTAAVFIVPHVQYCSYKLRQNLVIKQAETSCTTVLQLQSSPKTLLERGHRLARFLGFQSLGLLGLTCHRSADC